MTMNLYGIPCEFALSTRRPPEVGLRFELIKVDEHTKLTQDTSIRWALCRLSNLPMEGF
jgi:hypothetical protein